MEGEGKLPSAKKMDAGKYQLYYRYSDMHAIVDMLRNEGPVFLIHVPEGNNNTRLATAQELVGEGEES